MEYNVERVESIVKWFYRVSFYVIHVCDVNIVLNLYVIRLRKDLIYLFHFFNYKEILVNVKT